MKLEGKSIVVTGASAGMGQAVVTLFAQEGANVIAVARRKERLDALAEALKEEPGKVIPYVGDVSDPAACVMIGDTQHDAEVAAAIGAKCVLYTGGHQSRALLEAACPHVIDDLALLPDLLESL